MSYAISIAKNAGAKLIATVVTMGATALFAIVAAKYLGDVGFGELTFALSFTAIFSVLSDLGINIFAVKEVAQNPSRSSDFLGTLFALRIFLGLGLLVITMTGGRSLSPLFPPV